jgi:uncharacterized protein YjbI with pentapeptide repeats
MNSDSPHIHGKKFSQDAVNFYLQGGLERAVGGQPATFKTLFAIFASALTIISGSFAGMLGGYISFGIFFDPKKEARLFFGCLTLIVIVWVIQSVYRGLSKGLITALLVAIASSIFLVYVYRDSLFLGLTLFFILLAISAAFLSLLAGSLSSAMIFALFYKNQQSLKVIYAFLTITTSIGMSYWSGSDSEKTLLFPQLMIFAFVKFVAGLLSGIIAITANLSITSFETKNSKHFLFLQNWAIALCSWGGTSFYNLDLSGVNFREAKLANTDLRARKLYRTCFQGVTGLDRARVDNKYLDLDKRKVQRLLTHGCSEDKDFSGINLQGAYLQNADMQKFQLIESNLTGAYLEDAKLQNSILVRARATGVDFTDADLTGTCIEDWSVNSQTIFLRVKCNYIYRKYENGQPTDRYPTGRNFEPGEFEALHQQVSTVVELVFKEGINWRALSFTFREFEIEDNGLGLELKGVEQRGDLWVVKVAHKDGASRQHVEERLNAIYDELHNLLAVKEQQVNKLLGIAENQAEALKEASKRPFGNSNFFLIIGSDITNLTGSGKINYDEASNTIRSIVANGCEPAQIAPLAQSLLEQFQTQKVATTVDRQAELIEQVILDQAKKDPFFNQFLVQQGQQIADAIPESTIASAIRNAIAQLT